MQLPSSKIFAKVLNFLGGFAGNLSANEFLATNPKMGIFYLGCTAIALASDVLIERLGESGAADQVQRLLKELWERTGSIEKAIESLSTDTSLHEIVSRDRTALVLKAIRSSHDDLEQLIQENAGLTAYVGRWLENWCAEQNIKIADLTDTVNRIESKLDQITEIDKAREALEAKLELNIRRSNELIRGVERAAGIATVLAEIQPQIAGLASHLNELIRKFDQDFGKTNLTQVEDLQLRLARATAANAESKFQASLDLLPESVLKEVRQVTELAIASELAVLRVRSYSLYRLFRFSEAAVHLRRILLLDKDDLVAMRLLAS